MSDDQNNLQPDSKVVRRRIEAMQRFNAIAGKIQKMANLERFERTLSYWLVESDRQLPSALLEWSVNRVSMLEGSELLAMKGVGIGRIHHLCRVLERALSSPEQGAASIPTAELTSGEVLRTSAYWQEVQRVVLSHVSPSHFLGRFARSLRDVPAFLWDTTLGDYEGEDLANLEAQPRIGSVRAVAIRHIFELVYTAVRQLDQVSHLGISLVHSDVRGIEEWVHRTLRKDAPPQYDQFLDRFVQPLLGLIEADGDADLSEIAKLRLGVDQPPVPRGDIAEAKGVTRQTVHNWEIRIALMLKVRWYEGQYVLDDLCERLGQHGADKRMHAIGLAAFALLFPERRYARLSELRDATKEALLETDATKASADSEDTKVRQRPSERLSPPAADAPASEHHIHTSVLRLLESG